MKILILIGPLFPQVGTNARLFSTLIPFLKEEHSRHIASFASVESKNAPPFCFADVPVFWCFDERQDFFRKIVLPAKAKLIDRGGFSDYLSGKLLLDYGKALLKRQTYNAVLSSMEPFFAADAASRLKGAKRKILYLMDPPASVSNGTSTRYRDRRLKKILAAQNVILTTPFIRQALAEHGYRRFDTKIIPVGFPLIEKNDAVRQREDDGRIHLLFCGWLYSNIRSPKYFLDIVSQLDERFVVTFMGRECEKLTERFDIRTKAELITLPQQPYETALQAMADADIMINIGNSVPVHMPSKTLEYINTGKPFVNFYKLDDCPTLYYTKRYPLCLNMSEKDTDLDAAAQRFIDFCVENKGRTVDRAYIETEYKDCTPEYIAQKILDALGDHHD